MRTALVGCIAASLGTATSQAGFAGFVAYSRNVGANTVIDVFVGVSNASDSLLAVYNVTSYGGVFVQGPGASTRGWKPALLANSRRTSDDSFMTAGTFSGGAYGGEYYASTNTNRDPNFTGTSWNGTTSATAIPPLAGWYSSDPTSVDNIAEPLSGVTGLRKDSLSLDATGSLSGSSSGTVFGIWCAHLVLAGGFHDIGDSFAFEAFATVRDGLTGEISQGGVPHCWDCPSPSALALLSLSGLASRRRRS